MSSGRSSREELCYDKASDVPYEKWVHGEETLCGKREEEPSFFLLQWGSRHLCKPMELNVLNKKNLKYNLFMKTEELLKVTNIRPIN